MARGAAHACAFRAQFDGTTLPRRARSLPAGIARRLAAEILSRAQTGARLGSESQLCERFNVSRLTLRQAIRLLQDSGLVECRRGRGNGLVVLDERTAGTIRLVLADSIAGGSTRYVAGMILFQLNCFIPALAVSRATEPQRGQLEASLLRVECAIRSIAMTCSVSCTAYRAWPTVRSSTCSQDAWQLMKHGFARALRSGCRRARSRVIFSSSVACWINCPWGRAPRSSGPRGSRLR